MQSGQEHIILLLGSDDLTHGCKSLRFLEDVTHQHVEEFFLCVLFFELVRRAVTDRRVAKHWPRALLHELIQLVHMLSQI